MKLILSGSVENIATRSDKTVKVVIGTQELDNDQAAKLISFRNEFVKVLLSTDEIEKQVEKLVSDFPIKDSKKKTTPSQRLRFAIQNYHKAIESKEDSESYYESTINKLIIHYENLTYEFKENNH